ncbi:MAG: acetoacetate--CoA ligase [Verrucomicrobiales bacterium]
MTDEKPLWTPSPERIAAANMSAFVGRVEERFQIEIDGYESLWRWSVDCPEQFWSAVWEFCDVRAHRRWDEVLIGADRMPGAQWFAGAELNFAENLLRSRSDRAAIVSCNEGGDCETLTFGQLYQEVARISAWMRAVGVNRGDRVAALLPNVAETVVTMLAAASIGATFSSCSPDFGSDAVVQRFSQINPLVLVTTDRYRYAGKEFEMAERVAEIVEQLPSVRQAVIVAGDRAVPPPLDCMIRWDEIPATDEPLEFEPLPFDHPLYILYSSGTTGRPKCIVHGAGGTLLQHLKELVLHTDLTRDDRLLYYTSCGWMMWNWLVSGLAAEATIVLYDGSPTHPKWCSLFDLVDRLGVTVFGTSAKFLVALEKEGIRPRESHDLGSLRTILSTGSPLSAESFDYVYRDVKSDLCLASISGGTDIVSCFALGNPLLPVWPGELQSRGLGMRVDVLDAAGEAVRGSEGELVCTAPFPSMPVGFWNDPGGEAYHNAYFARFADVWCHGDYASITDHGGMRILGRSDAVLNPSGVRIGTGEIYPLLEAIPEIMDSVIVGQDWEGDTRVVLFVQLRDCAELDDRLVATIKSTIRAGASPRHVPAKVIEVGGIPYTRSGKKVELAVRDIVHGRAVENKSALANPESLAYFENRSELLS